MKFIRQYIAYLKDNPNGYWFKRRLFGWGWIPATKEGWGIIGVYTVLLLGLAFTLDDNSPPREIMFMFVLPLLFITTSLIHIAYKKGEKPRWSWGFPDEEKDGK